MRTPTLTRAIRTAMVVAILLVGRAGELLACPGCIEGSDPALQAGFMWSGLFLMATPYLVVGIIGGGLYYAYRKSVRREVDSFLQEESSGSSGEDRARSFGS